MIASVPCLVEDFDYYLPEELIAQQPASKRSESRLLRLSPKGMVDGVFSDVLKLLQPNDCLVVNDTRVIKARLFATKSTGGQIEIMIDRLLNSQEVLAMIRASKAPKIGTLLQLKEHTAQVLDRQSGQYRLRFSTDVLPLLEAQGTVPLPPYIRHTPDEQDTQRYQTVYAAADKPGAVAAPTAGLHFDEALLATIKAKGVTLAQVTLHVGAGTFAPVRATQISEHIMHSEWFSVPLSTVNAIQAAKSAGGRCVAVGTTSVRALESAALSGSLQALSGDTSIFITPGFHFNVVDALITNFHLPKSTLLMLVSAFAGTEAIGQAYAHAIAQRYRFFSYGDAMWLDKNQDNCRA
ncbi:MAG: tRNA preQ1(34) S-adenosylmethionine ribosyltransferase-isomerase QueA [Burkholderiaceae bacterium]|nr:tRNA preQ1(34) S-adenosylmethionine ribosyltransferase-isomerase QueA [Burkholderiaceae bacterium]